MPLRGFYRVLSGLAALNFWCAVCPDYAHGLPEQDCPRAEALRNTAQNAATELQSCLDAAEPGARLILSPGVYRIESPLALKKSLSLATRGSDEDSAGCGLQSATVCATLQAAGSDSVLEASGTDITLQHLSLKGRVVSRESSSACSGKAFDSALVSVTRCKRCSLNKVEVTGAECGTAVLVRDSTKVILRASFIHDNGRAPDRPADGIRIVGSKEVEVNDSRLVDNSDHAISARASESVRIVDNSVSYDGGAKRTGTSAFALDIKSGVIEGNYIDCSRDGCGTGLLVGDPSKEAVLPDDPGEIRISDNLTINAPRSMHLGAGALLSLSNNHQVGQRGKRRCADADVSTFSMTSKAALAKGSEPPASAFSISWARDFRALECGSETRPAPPPEAERAAIEGLLRAMVGNLYDKILGRKPSSSELENFLPLLVTGEANESLLNQSLLEVSSARSARSLSPQPIVQAQGMVQVTSAAPTKVQRGVEATITVEGSGFDPEATILIGDSPCTDTYSLSETILACTTVLNKLGTFPIMVRNPNEEAGTLAQGVTVTAAPPVLTFNPRIVPAQVPSTLAIIGSGLVAGTKITVGSVPCSGVTAVSESEVACVVPSLPAGAYAIKVARPGTAEVTLAKLAVSAAPLVSDVEPRAVQDLREAEIILRGSNFSPKATVLIGDTPCKRVRFISRNVLRCSAPPKPEGTYPVRVTNLLGTRAVKQRGALDGEIQFIAEFETASDALRQPEKVATFEQGGKRYSLIAGSDGIGLFNRNNEFDYRVYQPTFDAKFGRPAVISAQGRNLIVVPDTGGNRLIIMDSNLENLVSIGSPQSPKPFKIRQPIAVFPDTQSNRFVYVIQADGQRLFVPIAYFLKAFKVDQIPIDMKLERSPYFSQEDVIKIPRFQKSRLHFAAFSGASSGFLTYDTDGKLLGAFGESGARLNCNDHYEVDLKRRSNGFGCACKIEPKEDEKKTGALAFAVGKGSLLLAFNGRVNRFSTAGAVPRFLNVKEMPQPCVFEDTSAPFFLSGYIRAAHRDGVYGVADSLGCRLHFFDGSGKDLGILGNGCDDSSRPFDSGSTPVFDFADDAQKLFVARSGNLWLMGRGGGIIKSFSRPPPIPEADWNLPSDLSWQPLIEDSTVFQSSAGYLYLHTDPKTYILDQSGNYLGSIDGAFSRRLVEAGGSDVFLGDSFSVSHFSGLPLNPIGANHGALVPLRFVGRSIRR